ncbi:hypothetical protein H2C43_03265 [Corynebacterium glutamicum]|uniref:Hypothetical membrane protein n=2 Tax=Corynebacterium glutamicum TaxID=1718 RepID=Q8NM22_CORGL|nr:hypothetical protein B7P23_14685 [Corynebacterium glutamicum]CCH25884.1 hypothetical membrane protein [Corynebacterium glutamicum K051]BAC00154.1 Hypothetical membrane protein [Corynebacterium glutamicum ATCC 13032]AUI02148.1 hypothetical protein CYL77_13985 [Corynebacterium glutamicum]AUI02964.1 hypothetical protein C0I99_01985 [Corynebacterium glutamicum]
MYTFCTLKIWALFGNFRLEKLFVVFVSYIQIVLLPKLERFNMKLSKATRCLVALMFAAPLMSAPLANAVDNTWFNGVVTPGTTMYEGAGSWGFLRTSSNASSGLTDNPLVVMTCRLGIYSSVGGDTCSVSTSQLNNERASFTYEYRLGGQEAPARAWIGGIPSGGMSIADSQDEIFSIASESTRWTDGSWSLQEVHSSAGDVQLKIVSPEVQAVTNVSAEAFESRGGSISLNDGTKELSFLVFPESSEKPNEIIENSNSHNIEMVSAGVFQRITQGNEILEIQTGSGLALETSLVY